VPHSSSCKLELVRQEFYGRVLAHYAVRWLMHQAASEYQSRHDQLSFVGHVQLQRRTQPQFRAFPQSRAGGGHWFHEWLAAGARCGRCVAWDSRPRDS